MVQDILQSRMCLCTNTACSFMSSGDGVKREAKSTDSLSFCIRVSMHCVHLVDAQSVPVVITKKYLAVQKK